MGIADAGNGIVMTVELDGKAYNMSKMSLGMFKKAGASLQERNFRFIKDVMKLIPEGKERGAAIKAYLKPLSDNEISEYLGTSEGGIYAMYLCIHVNHPELKYDVFEKMLTPENLDKIKQAQTVQAAGGSFEGNAPTGSIPVK